MGVGAYNRGSKSISDQIKRDFEQRGGYRKSMINQMERAEVRISELEAYCLNAQALFVDATDRSSAKGFLKSSIYTTWIKKRFTAKVKEMHDQCLRAHVDWVNSDLQQSFVHLSYCLKKAKSWHNMLEYLNNGFRYPFKVPCGI
ncbi:MAG: hypothetical protein HAW67_04895 [Endozoicomonadaceae bacterium]|nr:hypothetical protein [Endozoicomonadaceae bacterium]